MQDPDRTIRIPFAKPFNWPALLAFLGPRAFPGIEDVSANHYRRVILQQGMPVIISATHVRDDAFVLVTAPAGMAPVSDQAVRFFDLESDPITIGKHLAKDKVLKGAGIHLRGTRIPGAWSPFELAVRAIIGQQVSVKAATTFASRLVTTFGTPIPADTDPAGTLIRTFPTPAVLARADLTSIGLIRARAKWISALAATLEAEPAFFDDLHPLDHAIRELTRLPGIGQWTAHYIAMRALKEADAFPTGDLGLIRAYSQLAGKTVSTRDLDRIAERWRPWRAYAAMHLWMSDPTAGG
jgi:AraC family transcriptional regulator, regulatory protein of adaptative response / DNA-3-methyladenine glycosylase II